VSGGVDWRHDAHGCAAARAAGSARTSIARERPHRRLSQLQQGAGSTGDALFEPTRLARLGVLQHAILVAAALVFAIRRKRS